MTKEGIIKLMNTYTKTMDYKNTVCKIWDSVRLKLKNLLEYDNMSICSDELYMMEKECMMLSSIYIDKAINNARNGLYNWEETLEKILSDINDNCNEYIFFTVIKEYIKMEKWGEI